MNEEEEAGGKKGKDEMMEEREMEGEKRKRSGSPYKIAANT